VVRSLPMIDSDPDIERLKRLRQVKVRPEPDLSLAFLRRQFEQQVAKPFRQLGPIAQLWGELLPAELVAHTKLEGLSRGELRVSVDSSSRLYELNHLLRNGVEQDLIGRHKGSLSRIRLQVGQIDSVPGESLPSRRPSADKPET